MPDSVLERVRTACLRLPEATEKVAWGAPTFRVNDKLFAMFASADSQHGGGRAALWCHAPPTVQAELVAAAPERFFVPPYMGKSGWIGLWLDAVEEAELALHVEQAYRVVAPKKLVALL